MLVKIKLVSKYTYYLTCNLISNLILTLTCLFLFLSLSLLTGEHCMAAVEKDVHAKDLNAHVNSAVNSAELAKTEKKEFVIPELKEYTDSEILQKIILPLIEKHEEIKWFADKNVAATKEAPGNTQKPGWTQELIKLERIAPFAGKYIELERMLSSIVFFQLFYDGTDAAYQKLISVQKKDEQLSQKSFKELHQLARSIAKDAASYQAVISMLIFSDLGKTPIATQRARENGVLQHDHDDFIEALFSLSREKIARIIPSFVEVPPETQVLIMKVCSAMKIHLGHVLHTEGGQRMFTKFMEAAKADKISKEILDFAMLIQFCDVAAQAAHVNKDGSLSLTNNTYLGYLLVADTLKAIQAGKNPSEALQGYLETRGKLIGLSANTPINRVIIRLACMLRLYTREDAEDLLAVATKLSAEESFLLIEQFGVESKEIGINAWARNPTYLPTVLLNLAKFQDTTEKRHLKMQHVLNGALCLAKFCKYYASTPENLNSTTPINFNELSGIATADPSLFTPESFNPELFMVQKNGSVVKEEVPKPTAAFSPQFDAAAANANAAKGINLEAVGKEATLASLVRSQVT